VVSTTLIDIGAWSAP